MGALGSVGPVPERRPAAGLRRLWQHDRPGGGRAGPAHRGRATPRPAAGGCCCGAGPTCRPPLTTTTRSWWSTRSRTTGCFLVWPRSSITAVLAPPTPGCGPGCHRGGPLLHRPAVLGPAGRRPWGRTTAHPTPAAVGCAAGRGHRPRRRDPAMYARAAALGERIRGEDGVARAVAPSRPACDTNRPAGGS